MTTKQVQSLSVGNVFRTPSTNKHDVDGFREYTVIQRDDTAATVEDAHGYQSRIIFNSPYSLQSLKNAELLSVA